MAVEVKLPELGDGIESGDVLDVMVQEGDTIEKDQTICELETDKAMVEVPSSHGGKIVKVHIASGQSIPVGATLLTVESVESRESSAESPAPASDRESPASDTASPAPAAESPTSAAESPPPAEPAREAPPRSPAAAPAGPAASERPPQPAAPPRPSAPPAARPVESPAARGPAPAGPAIRRLAREVGIDLGSISGSGSGGRITREDVLAAVRQSSAPSPAATEAPPEVAEPSEPEPPQTTIQSTADDWGPIRVERMTKIRRTIATKMHESWTTSPRVTNFDDADVTELERIRQASKSDYAARGIKLTSMPFVIKAVALALRQNPQINASIDENNEQIIYKQYVNLGIAVDTDRGLVVPSLRRPDELSIPDIARAVNNIAENARHNNFKLEDLRGSTFTISNLGAVGGTYSTPIINVPEVAILLLGRSRQLPMIVDDEITPRLMMPLSISYDHRLVDGATAARFLNDVIAYLENPSRLMIAP